MAGSVRAYRKDQSRPDIAIEWFDGAGVIDFSSGWTFEVRIVAASDPSTVLVTKTAGIVGAATLPNVTIQPAVADWAPLTATDAGVTYLLFLYATNASRPDVLDPEEGIEIKLLPALS